MKKLNGFTLIELLVMMVIIGILVATIMATFDEYIKNNPEPLEANEIRYQ